MVMGIYKELLIAKVALGIHVVNFGRLKIKKPSSKMKWALFVIRSGVENLTNGSFQA